MLLLREARDPSEGRRVLPWSRSIGEEETLVLAHVVQWIRRWSTEPETVGSTPAVRTRLGVVFNGSTRRLGRLGGGSNPSIQTMMTDVKRAAEIAALHAVVDDLDKALTSALRVVSSKEIKQTAQRIAFV